MISLQDNKSGPKTDWSKCCLCQSKTKEELKSPPVHYSCNSDGYTMISRNIPLFQELDSMPIILDPVRLDDGTGIEETLRKNRAMYHQTCRQMFSNNKVDRARAKRNKSSDDFNQATPSKLKRKSYNSTCCFLCEKSEPESELHRAMTENIDRRLKECAHNLNDGKLLALLSAGDAVAQELKYHLSCLTDLYNKERIQLAKQNKGSENYPSENSYFPLVFSQLVVNIIEAQRNSSSPVVLQLVDLVKLCNERLLQLEENPNVNATRLKDKLLQEIPGLEAYKKGRNIVLAFREDIGLLISKACDYSDAMVLAKAANILRKNMINHKWKFDGKLDEEAIHSSLPPSLLQFVCMIEHGVDIESQLQFGATTTDFALAQLLQYNCFAKSKEGIQTQRHATDRETPLPIYIGLSIHGKGRKKELIESLHEQGLSISYKRVLEISAQLGDAVVKRYVEDGIVCPPQLKTGLFCTAAMDNIDHNPSSTTSTTSFHGTSISVFQHVHADRTGRDREPVQFGPKKTMNVPELPDSYTNVMPAFFKDKNPSPPQSELKYESLPRLCLKNEYEWLESVNLQHKVDGSVNVTWSAHHAEKKRGLEFKPSITSLLPLLRDEAHSVSTVKHCMKMITDTIHHLNPGQTPVMAADQPLYALAKQVQWQWPGEFGEDKFLVMFGGLHIEMAAFRSLGTLLKGSGWTGTIAEADVTTPGTAESFLSVSSLTKTRHMHQVTASCLYMLLKEAYEYSTTEESEKALSFEEWRE